MTPTVCDLCPHVVVSYPTCKCTCICVISCHHEAFHVHDRLVESLAKMECVQQVTCGGFHNLALLRSKDGGREGRIEGEE